MSPVFVLVQLKVLLSVLFVWLLIYTLFVVCACTYGEYVLGLIISCRQRTAPASLRQEKSLKSSPQWVQLPLTEY